MIWQLHTHTYNILRLSFVARYRYTEFVLSALAAWQTDSDMYSAPICSNIVASRCLTFQRLTALTDHIRVLSGLGRVLCFQRATIKIHLAGIMHHPAISNSEQVRNSRLRCAVLCCASEVIYTAYMETRATEPEKLGGTTKSSCCNEVFQWNTTEVQWRYNGGTTYLG